MVPDEVPFLSHSAPPAAGAWEPRRPAIVGEGISRPSARRMAPAETVPPS